MKIAAMFKNDIVHSIKDKWYNVEYDIQTIHASSWL